MLKYLRIAVTALCLTACVLLGAFWARSHRFYEVFATNSPNPRLVIESVPGSFIVSTAPAYHHQSRTFPIRPGWESIEIRHLPEFGIYLPTYTGIEIVAHRNYIQIDYAWAVALNVALLALLWMRPSKCFSLRTLLIAMTLVAVALGIVVMSR